MANEQNNWSEYSRLVIAELERLNDGISKLNGEIQDLKREIVELKAKEDNVKEIKNELEVLRSQLIKESNRAQKLRSNI